MENKKNEQSVGPNLAPNQVRVTVEAGFLTGPTVIIYDRGKGGHNVVAYFPWGSSLRYGAETLMEAVAHACSAIWR